MCFWLRLAKDWVENNDGRDTVAGFVGLTMDAVSGSGYFISYQATGPTSLLIAWDNQKPSI